MLAHGGNNEAHFAAEIIPQPMRKLRTDPCPLPGPQSTADQLLTTAMRKMTRQQPMAAEGTEITR